MRALLAALALTACASNAQLSAQFPEPWQHAVGDFDGDRRPDRADFEEDDEGHLLVIVRRAAAPAHAETIWGGDIASTPHYAIAAAAPATYHTDCEGYGGCTSVPAQVTLTHDGLIVREIDGPALTLYFWDGATFQNLAIRD